MTEFNGQWELRKFIDSPQNHCFVCSHSNPLGLQVRFEQHDGVVWARFVPNRWHVGWQGIVHGGVLASLLDEAMAYTIFFGGILGLTARMEVRYRAPARVGEALEVTAHITKDSRRLVDVEGRILRGAETVVDAAGRFIKAESLDPAQLRASAEE